MTSLLNAIKMNTTTTTLNGDVAQTTAGNALLDYVALIGGMRNATVREIEHLFLMAFRENPIKALQLLFYTRDIPNRGGGGLGERRIFYTIYMYLVQNKPEIALALGSLIPEYGSWRDVRELAKMCFKSGETEFAKNLIEYHTYVIFTQQDNKLAAKWAIDENEKNKNFREFAINAVTTMLNITRKAYRQTVSAARKGVVERLMSEKRWDEITYQHVPSRAMKLYRKAFGKHDTQRFGDFIESALKGETKVNAGVLNPVELYKKASAFDTTIEAQWRQLPNYVDENCNALVMADVSGSMTGTPMDVCISLAIYFAERNKGIFNNCFLTFSANPTLQELCGKTLNEKINNLKLAQWDMNTDLDKAFEMILKSAVKARVASEDMPNVILVITDGQFDAGGCGFQLSAHERIEQKYKNAGYKMPHIVYWNVNVNKATFPALTNKYTTLVSGYSASVLKSVFNVVNNPNIDVVQAILDTGRYDAIRDKLLAPVE